MRKAKIVMVAMFKNEAPVLRRMLDSTLGHCDYYIFQNNGSTDGSSEIARDWLNEHNLDGVVYVCEEGWKGFGWNRDHLIQYAQQHNHGCDWILKMDCDEILQVDPDFDWSILDDKSIDSFHIPAVAGSTMYKRCWLWNADRTWRFYHDPCHEIIYCQEPDVGENFYRHDLPPSIRQVGLNEGQSWSNPTKFVSDSLKLEEKMIVDGDMTNDDRTYHFWYIGKSYFDAYACQTFPLGEQHQKEFARRAIWYFDQWMRHTFRNKEFHIDETAYNALIFMGIAQQFLKQYDAAITTFERAGPFAPPRNDHLVGLAECYRDKGDYENMRQAALEMLLPERKNPYPIYSTFIDNEYYHDTGTLPQRLYQEAMNHIAATPKQETSIFNINKLPMKSLFVVDNFYSNPDEIRQFALTQVEYQKDLRWYKGLRSTKTYRSPGIKRAFEKIIGEPIIDFEGGYNGVFQIMMSEDPQVYHFDTQRWAAMIYLTPHAPIISGTRMHMSRRNGTIHRDQPGSDEAFRGDFYDSTQFDITDSAANLYNRLVIMDAGHYHSAGPYFGNTMETGRLTHLFFFC